MPCMSCSSHRRRTECRCALRQPAIGFIALHAQARLDFSVRLSISKCLFRRASSSCASHRAITIPNDLRRFTVLRANAFLAPETPKSPAHTENVLGGLCCSSRHMSRSEAFSMGDSVVRGIKPRSFCHNLTSDMEHPWCGDVKNRGGGHENVVLPQAPGRRTVTIVTRSNGCKSNAIRDIGHATSATVIDVEQTTYGDSGATRPWRKS